MASALPTPAHRHAPAKADSGGGAPASAPPPAPSGLASGGASPGGAASGTRTSASLSRGLSASTTTAAGDTLSASLGPSGATLGIANGSASSTLKVGVDPAKLMKGENPLDVSMTNQVKVGGATVAVSVGQDGVRANVKTPYGNATVAATVDENGDMQVSGGGGVNVPGVGRVGGEASSDGSWGVSGTAAGVTVAGGEAADGNNAFTVGAGPVNVDVTRLPGAADALGKGDLGGAASAFGGGSGAKGKGP